MKMIHDFAWEELEKTRNETEKTKNWLRGGFFHPDIVARANYLPFASTLWVLKASSKWKQKHFLTSAKWRRRLQFRSCVQLQFKPEKFLFRPDRPLPLSIKNPSTCHFSQRLLSRCLKRAKILSWKEFREEFRPPISALEFSVLSKRRKEKNISDINCECSALASFIRSRIFVELAVIARRRVPWES